MGATARAGIAVALVKAVAPGNKAFSTRPRAGIARAGRRRLAPGV